MESTFVKATDQMPYKRLGNTDIYASILSFGCAQLSRDCVFNDDNSECIGGYEEVVRTVHKALQKGINYFDSAPLYGCGKSEVILGKALESIPRKSYYLATKVGRTPDCAFDYSKQNTLTSVQNSLRKLKVDYIDVIQVHDCEFADDIDIIINETLPALHSLRQIGKVKYIGITGYDINVLKKIIEQSHIKIDTVLSYCRCTPFDQTLLKYLSFFEEKGIAVINGSVLGIGLLTNSSLPYWHCAGDEIREACSLAINYCDDRKVDISRLAVYYAISQNSIATHLIGIENENLLDKNLDVVLNGINAHENKVFQEIQLNIFSRIKVNNWEGIEVNRYRADREAFAKFLRGD